METDSIKKIFEKIEEYFLLEKGLNIQEPEEQIFIGIGDYYVTNIVIKHFVESRKNTGMSTGDIKKLASLIPFVLDRLNINISNPKQLRNPGSRLLGRQVPKSQSGIQLIVASDNRKIIGIFYNRDFMKKFGIQIQNSAAGRTPSGNAGSPISELPTKEVPAARLSDFQRQNSRFDTKNLSVSMGSKSVVVNETRAIKSDEIFEMGLEEFPALLREIPDMPRRLFGRGTLPPSDSVFLCVVGSRNYSPYGREVCEFLIGRLAHEPQIRRPDGSSRLIIVSGLALGIDGLAHKAALETGLTCLALPGSGLQNNVLYPRANRKIAQKILENGGMLLSEFEPDWKPRPESFLQRNRIMAGLSHAVLIIEAEVASGTMNTARLATDYNREVLTVPGSIFSRHTAGPHSLIGTGARLVTSPADIIDTLGLTPPPEPKKSSGKTKNLELFDSKNSLELTKRFPTATPDELTILDILIKNTEATKDILVETTALPIHRLNIALTLLELTGHIKIKSNTIRLA